MTDTGGKSDVERATALLRKTKRYMEDPYEDSKVDPEDTALIAQAFREVRESCAKIADDFSERPNASIGENAVGRVVAQLIRASGSSK